MLKKIRCTLLRLFVLAGYMMFGLLNHAVAQQASSVAVQEDALSFGQFYYGFSASTLRLQTDEIDGITEPASENIVVGKLLLGNFYANGHVDSYITIPFKRSFELGDVKGKFSPGIEAGYNFYLRPLGQTHHSPFLGIALSFPNYEFFTSAGKGSRKYDIALPIQLGYGFYGNKGQIDVGIRRAYGQSGDYYFSPDEETRFQAEYPELFLNYKYVTNAKITKVGADAKPPRKDWWPFLGIGLSSAWFTQGNDVHNQEKSLSASGYGQPIGEYTVGLVRAFSEEKSKRLILQYSYRPINIEYKAYEKSVIYQLDSRGVELLYNPRISAGIAPFFGLGINDNKMVFTDEKGQTYQDEQQQMSVLLGWDILPNPNAGFHLRFGLRYMQEAILSVEEENKQIKFPNLEVSYVNLVWQF